MIYFIKINNQVIQNCLVLTAVPTAYCSYTYDTKEIGSYRKLPPCWHCNQKYLDTGTSHSYHLLFSLAIATGLSYLCIPITVLSQWVTRMSDLFDDFDGRRTMDTQKLSIL